VRIDFRFDPARKGAQDRVEPRPCPAIVLKPWMTAPMVTGAFIPSPPPIVIVVPDGHEVAEPEILEAVFFDRFGQVVWMS